MWAQIHQSATDRSTQVANGVILGTCPSLVPSVEIFFCEPETLSAQTLCHWPGPARPFRITQGDLFVELEPVKVDTHNGTFQFSLGGDESEMMEDLYFYQR